jgi:hypothetical protein
MVLQAVLAVRDKIAGVASTHHGEWSPGQYRLLKMLRLFGGIGAVIVWSALIYALIDVGVGQWMHPAHKGP